MKILSKSSFLLNFISALYLLLRCGFNQFDLFGSGNGYVLADLASRLWLCWKSHYLKGGQVEDYLPWLHMISTL